LTGSTADAKSDVPTGERFDPPLMSGRLIEAEHFARYAWAAQFASGKRVLDAACGMGYGTAMLAAGSANEVVGVDLDEAVIARVSADPPKGASFRVADLRRLPFGEDEFDLVVCFEAIEHVPEPEVVLDQLARVLRPDGLLIVSTPNRDVYTPGNPFHLRELTPNELEAELEKRFASVVLRRQHTWISSAIFDDEAFSLGGHNVIDGVDVHKEAAGKPGEETYTIGMASDGDVPVGRALLSLTFDIDVRDWSSRLDAADLVLSAAPLADDRHRDAELQLLRSELTELRRQLVKSESEMARFADLEARLTLANEALEEYDSLKGRIADLQARHELVINSSSWRLTHWFRRLGALIRPPSP
jgi:SAM-dependent methyltransferase